MRLLSMSTRWSIPMRAGIPAIWSMPCKAISGALPMSRNVFQAPWCWRTEMREPPAESPEWYQQKWSLWISRWLRTGEEHAKHVAELLAEQAAHRRINLKGQPHD